MEDKEARRWLDFFMQQPRSAMGGIADEPIPRVASFVIDLEEDRFVVTFRFEDGRERSVSMNADVALYLREYLTTGLMHRAAGG